MTGLRSINLSGIRFRLILLVLIAALPFVWNRISDIRASEAANIEAIRADVISTAARGAAQQAEVFAEARTLLSVVAEAPVVTYGSAAECSAFLVSVKENRPWAKNLLVVDPKGRFHCATTSATTDLDISDRDYFQRAVKTGYFAVSDFIFSKIDGQPIIAVAFPALTPVGVLKGVVVASVNMSWFNQTVTSIGRTLGARVLIVDASGKVIARYPAPPVDAYGKALDAGMNRDLNAAKDGWFEDKDDDGVRRLYGVAHLTGLGARFAVGFSLETAAAEARAKIRSAYINAAAMTTLIVLVALLFGEIFFLVPIRDLVTATRQLTEGDLGARARVRSGSPEFRELASSFNIMADRLSALATIDGLTGIANRRRFDQYLDQEWRRGLRNQTAMALALIDIDGFKLFNDSYGHQAGDECLRAVASELARFAQRSEDLVGRYGGEEFVIGLPGLTATEAYRHAERARIAIETLAVPGLSGSLHVTISIGVATCVPTAGMAAETLIAMADAALYDAKHAGRNRVALFREGPIPATIRVA